MPEPVKSSPETAGPDWLKYLPRLFPMGSVIVVACLLVSMAIYGASIVVENNVLEQGKETRFLREQNADLSISLDRLKAFKKVADASSKMQGLQAASEIIDVAARPERIYGVIHPSRLAVLKDSYGY